MRIRTRLFLLLLALTLVPLLILGAVSYHVARDAVTVKVSEQLSKVRDELAGQVTEVFGRIDGVIDELENDRNFELYLRYVETKDVSILREIIERTFGHHLARDERFLGVIATFPTGPNIAVLKPGMVDTVPVDARRIAITGSDLFCVSRPVTRGGARGTIHFFFRPELLMERVARANIGEGRPVAGFFILDGRIFTTDEAANRPLLGLPYESERWIEYEGHVAAVGPVAGTPVHVGASMPEEQFLAPARRVRNLTLLVVVAAVGLVAVASLFFATTIVRPVREMVGMTRRLADEQLHARLSATRGDELGDLARDFNAMAGKLESSRDRIAERTEELVRERSRIEMALAMCRNVLSVHGFEAQVRAVCEEVRRHGRVTRVAVYLVNEEGTRIEGVAAAGFLSAYMRGQDYPVESRPGDELYRAIPRAAASGRTERFRAADGTGRDASEEYACVPLRARQKTLGVIAICVAGEDGRLSDETVATVEAFADLVSLTILEAKTAADSRQAYIEVLTALAGVIDKRDAYTGMHTENVLSYSTALARTLGMTEEEIDGIRIGAILHDIGKVAMPDTSLKKTGTLTTDEYEEMKRHPMLGFEILSGSRYLKAARQIVRHHHERWDGSGYPDGLKGPEIPVAAQIVAVADAYDAMTTDRPYRKGVSTGEAIGRLKEAAGSQFNPRLVELFIETMGLEEADREGAVHERREGDALWCTVAGCLNIDAGRTLIARIAEWLKAHRAPVVINLLDSVKVTDGGLWQILRSSWKCRANGSTLVLVVRGEIQEKVLALASDFPFRIAEDLETAKRLAQTLAEGEGGTAVKPGKVEEPA